MFVKAVALASKAMFPIFATTDVGAGRIHWRLVGTGFFIDSKGHFVSVAHLFEGFGAATTFHYAGRIPDEVENPPIRIMDIGRDDRNDIYIGEVASRHADFLSLRKDPVELGRSVAVAGYPFSKISANQHGDLILSGVRRYFQPTFVLDRVAATAKFPGRLPRIHNGFLARDVGLFGMSGGPVFDPDGLVVGVQASVTDRRVSKGPDGRAIAVENAIVVGSEVIVSALSARGIALD